MDGASYEISGGDHEVILDNLDKGVYNDILLELIKADTTVAYESNTIQLVDGTYNEGDFPYLILCMLLLFMKRNLNQVHIFTLTCQMSN